MTTATGATSTARDIAALVGDGNCAPATADSDALRVTPADAQEIAAVLRVASERKLVVVPEGTGLHQHIGRKPERVDIYLSTARLKNVEHFDPGDLTLGVGAGITLAEIDAMLAPHGLFLPATTLPAIANEDRATIGGTLATAAHGPLRHGFGGVREFCIGVRFVTGDGKVAKGGGRVVKNVAGYDLMKLLIGSYGTLGVITSASFKLFPRPRQTRTFIAQFANLDEALAFRDRVVRTPLAPLCLELVSPGIDIGAGDRQSWRVLARAAGSDAVLARYRRELRSSVTADIDGAGEGGLWCAVTDFERTMAGRSGALTLNAAFPPSEAGAISVAQRIARESGFDFYCVGRFALAAMQFAFVPREHNIATEQYVNALRWRRWLGFEHGIQATIRLSPQELLQQMAWWPALPPETLDCMRLVKQALDPAGVLNPARFSTSADS